MPIEKVFIGNAITTGTNAWCFTRTFLEGEALRIFDLKAAELGQETVDNLKTVFNHVVTYFGPNDCLSKQKRYMRYRLTKPRNLTTRQYVGLVCDLNSRMAQIPPLFDTTQVLEESELVDFIRILILRHQLSRPLSSTASAQKTPTTSPGRSSLPPTRTAIHFKPGILWRGPKTMLISKINHIFPDMIVKCFNLQGQKVTRMTKKICAPVMWMSTHTSPICALIYH